jgi:hypothetical protein
MAEVSLRVVFSVRWQNLRFLVAANFENLVEPQKNHDDVRVPVVVRSSSENAIPGQDDVIYKILK